MPRTKADNPRIPIQVRLTPDERTRLDEAAKARGLDTSTWMRMVALDLASRANDPIKLTLKTKRKH